MDRLLRTLSPHRPTVFQAAVARAHGPSSELVWDGRLLRYRAWRGGDPASAPMEVPIQPDPAAWERFWAAMDAIGVWHWCGRYDADDLGPTSGPGWVVRMDHGRRFVDASGLAAFPDGEPGRPGPAFRRLCRELSALAGNRPVG